MNAIHLIGRAGDAPEFRTTKSGESAAQVSLAVSRSKKNGEETTDWFTVRFFGKTAEVARDYVSKGKQIAVSGRMLCDKWQDDQGQKHSRWYVNADRLELLGSKGESSGGTHFHEESVF